MVSFLLVRLFVAHVLSQSFFLTDSLSFKKSFFSNTTMLSSLLPLGTACLLLAQAQAGPLSHRASPASVIEGEGTVEAKLPSGDAVTVYLHGATVTSWKASDGDEKIFLSTASALDGSAAIRGGIPVVFPNFGSPPDEGQTSEMPSHGFARNSTWTFDSSTPQEDGSGVALKFLLDSASLSADYQAKWPYSAKLAYTVNLTQDNLNVHFSFENTDDQALDFQFLLHTYLTVPVSHMVCTFKPHRPEH